MIPLRPTSFSTVKMMTPEEVEAMNRASIVKNKGNAPTETSGGSQAPPVAGGGGEFPVLSSTAD